ncbi:MAG: hypothetical protein ACK4SA_08960 [Caldilinea sp.]
MNCRLCERPACPQRAAPPPISTPPGSGRAPQSRTGDR